MKILKTMRDVRILAKTPDVNSVNAYGFRSPEEVRVYLDELKKQVEETQLPDQSILGEASRSVAKFLAGARVVARHSETAAISIDRTLSPEQLKEKMRIRALDKAREKRDTGVADSNPAINLDDFSMTNTKKLDDQFDIIKDLHNKVEILDALELTVKQNFAGERNSIGAQILKTRKAVELKLKAALAFISKAAVKKEPKIFSDTVNPVEAKLLERAKGKFKKVEVKNFLFTKTDSTGKLYFVFQRHVILHDFQSDDEAFTYPTYVVVFTAAVGNDKKMTMHVTTLHSQRPPGTFKFGSTFKTEKAAVQELDALLDMDRIVDLMTKTKLPVTALPKAKFATAKAYIADVTVEDNVVRITTTKKMPKDPAAKSQIVTKIFADLRALLGYGNSQSLKYKTVPQPDNSVVLQFVLVPNASGRHKAALDDRQHRLLKTHFGFDDEDITRLIRVMQRGF